MEQERNIVFALHHGIYTAMEGELYRIAVRGEANSAPWGPGMVRALLEHNGILYDGGHYSGIYDTIENKVIAETPGLTHAFVSHKGELYDAGLYKVIKGRVRNTMKDQIIVERENDVLALVSHDDKLYDGGEKGIFDTSANRLIFDVRDKRKNLNACIIALVSHNGKMYHAETPFETVYETMQDLDHPVFTKKNYKRITSLASCDGRLCIAGEHGLAEINDTRSQTYLFPKFCISAVTSVSSNLFRRILKRAEKIDLEKVIEEEVRQPEDYIKSRIEAANRFGHHVD